MKPQAATTPQMTVDLTPREIDALIAHKFIHHNSPHLEVMWREESAFGPTPYLVQAKARRGHNPPPDCLGESKEFLVDGQIVALPCENIPRYTVYAAHAFMLLDLIVECPEADPFGLCHDDGGWYMRDIVSDGRCWNERTLTKEAAICLYALKTVGIEAVIKNQAGRTEVTIRPLPHSARPSH